MAVSFFFGLINWSIMLIWFQRLNCFVFIIHTLRQQFFYNKMYIPTNITCPIDFTAFQLLFNWLLLIHYEFKNLTFLWLNSNIKHRRFKISPADIFLCFSPNLGLIMYHIFLLKEVIKSSSIYSFSHFYFFCFLFRLSEDAFETIRLWLLIVTSLLRIILIPQYLQAYLNIAYMRVAEMKKEAGRITNKELQKKVYIYFLFLIIKLLFWSNLHI